MVVNATISPLIREAKAHQIYSIIRPAGAADVHHEPGLAGLVKTNQVPWTRP